MKLIHFHRWDHSSIHQLAYIQQKSEKERAENRLPTNKNDDDDGEKILKAWKILMFGLEIRRPHLI